MRVLIPHTGRLSVPWSNHRPSQRRSRSFAFFAIVFLTSCCILCHILIHTSVSFSTGVEGQEPWIAGEWQRLPQSIIIGARKCGTRALLEFLGIHSRVQIARDEVHFFDEDNKYDLGLDWYRRQMPFSLPEQMTIEKTPAYFVTDAAAHRIRAMNASIKLIVIVRDPVTRLVSDYAQLNANKVAKGEKPLRSFEQMVLLSNGEVDINYKPVRSSIYSVFFARWSEILLVDGDRLIADPFPEMERVQRFLGLENEITRHHFAFNSTKGFFCVRTPGSPAEKCLNDTKGRRHPVVDSSVVQTLRRFYAPYNRQFYLMVGHNFQWPEE